MNERWKATGQLRGFRAEGDEYFIFNRPTIGWYQDFMDDLPEEFRAGLADGRFELCEHASRVRNKIVLRRSIQGAASQS